MSVVLSWISIYRNWTITQHKKRQRNSRPKIVTHHYYLCLSKQVIVSDHFIFLENFDQLTKERWSTHLWTNRLVTNFTVHWSYQFLAIDGDTYLEDSKKPLKCQGFHWRNAGLIPEENVPFLYWNWWCTNHYTLHRSYKGAKKLQIVSDNWRNKVCQTVNSTWVVYYAPLEEWWLHQKVHYIFITRQMRLYFIK